MSSQGTALLRGALVLLALGTVLEPTAIQRAAASRQTGLPSLGEPIPAAPSGAPLPKRAVTAARLLLPFFEIDTARSLGATTFFSVRNEITQAVDVRVSLYATDSPQSPLHAVTWSLPGKAMRSVDVRSMPGLVADADGFARGFAIVETISGDAVIQGDYFQLNPDEAFATGSRLVNIDPLSPDNDLCSVFTVRFLQGGGFDGGTELLIWTDHEVAPEGTPVFSYSVYNQAGDLRLSAVDFRASHVAFRVSAEELTSSMPTDFGAIELQLTDGVQGHVAAIMSALGRYSVGLEAACRD